MSKRIIRTLPDHYTDNQRRLVLWEYLIICVPISKIASSLNNQRGWPNTNRTDLHLLVKKWMGKDHLMKQVREELQNEQDKHFSETFYGPKHHRHKVRNLSVKPETIRHYEVSEQEMIDNPMYPGEKLPPHALLSKDGEWFEHYDPYEWPDLRVKPFSLCLE